MTGVHQNCVLMGRIGAGAGAILAFYMAFLLYEDEQGAWQNRLDDLWITVNDRAKNTHSTATALFNRIGDVLTVTLNAIFGPRILSLHSFSSSSNASLGFAALVLGCMVEGASPKAAFLLMGSVFLGFVYISARIRNHWIDVVACLPFSVGYLALCVDLQSGGRPHWGQTALLTTGVALIFFISLLADVITVIVLRRLLATVANTVSMIRICLVILGLLLTAALLVLITLLFLPVVPVLFALNAGSILYCLLPVLLLAVLLLHMVLWPSLSRLIYPLCRYKIATNHKALLAVGALCATVALNRGPISMEWLLKHLP